MLCIKLERDVSYVYVMSTALELPSLTSSAVLFIKKLIVFYIELVRDLAGVYSSQTSSIATARSCIYK